MKRCILFVCWCVVLPVMAQQIEAKTDIENLEVKVGDVKRREGEFVLPTYNPKSHADMSRLFLKDLKGERTSIDLENKVTIIEYWTDRGMKNNMFWNQAREVEQRPDFGKDVQVVSIYYNPSVPGKQKIDRAKAALVRLDAPKRLLCDMDDGFAESFFVNGPVVYYIIDHRKQLVTAGRGDHPTTGRVFEMMENALKYLHVVPADSKAGAPKK